MSDHRAGPWEQELAALLAGGEGEAARFGARLPPGYREQTTPAEAAADAAEIGRLRPVPDGGAPADPDTPVMGAGHRLSVRPSTDPEVTFRLRRFGEQGMELTRTLPVLESFGLVVVESVPLRIGPGGPGEPALHIDDMGVRLDAPYGEEALRFVPDIHGPRLVEAIEASARHDADVDSLNRLVAAAGLDWHQVTLLRAYVRYWLQAGTDLGWADLAEPLAQYPDVARALVGYFLARFSGGGAEPEAERRLCLAQLDLVTHLEQDRVLRGLLGLVDATLRTNYFRRLAEGRTGSPLVLKLDSRAVPELPRPRPSVEAFVHGPRVEGIHLRAGLVARGGLRWSERPGDFRTEVLDLCFAQVKKNAIIVPTGAKGGFVCRAPGGPAPASGSPARGRPGSEQIRAAYEEFVAALLEITDNVSGGREVTPPGVVAYDGPDPYLVVAADKGTATYSDLANSLSEAAGFWLGDAFASGGSRGYDHKAMGITARGAWVAVRRHFRELGVEVARDPVRVVGVGDMSGDVFGNGMLRSRAIRLVAAFDHRHVFLDPDPDAGASFEERSRLAGLGRSSWADYDPAVISAGGGVWPRDAKSVPLAPAVRAVLGVTDEELSPPRLIRAVLSAPVDLIWFGGIGTYIKAPEESDTDVGDHANDAVRISSDQVRARVIAEGANLGITQRARIRYSRRGGRINADFIDNAAGVATSDREVNLKILLALAVERGRMDPGDRDGYLARSEDEVAEEVLRQVDHSVAALNRASAHSARQLDAYEALVDELEGAGRLDRAVEVLPDRDEFEVRRAAGAGLIRPELATILAYAKTDLVHAVESAPWVGEPAFLGAVLPYFPGPIRGDFADLVPDHRLYAQLVATDVAGEIVDQLGIIWAHDLAAELGRSLAEVAAAFWAARARTGAGELWAELERAAGAGEVAADTEAALHASVAEAVAGLSRALLLGRIPAGGAVPAADPGGVDGVDGVAPARLEGLRAAGADEEVARRYLVAPARVEAAVAQPLAAATGRPVDEVVTATRRLADRSGAASLAAGVTRTLDGTPPPDRLRVWQGRAVLDDLTAWVDGAVRDALGSGGPGAQEGEPVDKLVDAWIDARRPRLGSVAALGRPGADPIAVAALGLRRLERASADG